MIFYLKKIPVYYVEIDGTWQFSLNKMSYKSVPFVRM